MPGAGVECVVEVWDQLVLGEIELDLTEQLRPVDVPQFERAQTPLPLRDQLVFFGRLSCGFFPGLLPLGWDDVVGVDASLVRSTDSELGDVSSAK